MKKVAEDAANLVHRNVNKLYDTARRKIDEAKIKNASGLIEYAEDVKSVQATLREMQKEIAKLKELAAKPEMAKQKDEIAINIMSHEKQLDKVQRELRACSNDVRKEIADSERKALLQGGLSKRQPMSDFPTTSAPRQRTSRLKDLVTRMADRVSHSEQSMGSLVHSSSVLAQTHKEYSNQSSHIHTSDKLLSKYERRELTDKILLIIALIFYFAVVYYILQKRIISKLWIF